MGDVLDLFYFVRDWSMSEGAGVSSKLNALQNISKMPTKKKKQAYAA